jgi:hypothetical protein
VDHVPRGNRLRGFHAPISPNPAQKPIAQHKNAARGSDTNGQDELSQFNHRYSSF